MMSDCGLEGFRVRRIRVEKGLTLAELSRRSDVSRSTLCSMELGQRQVNSHTLLRISRALKVSLDYLMTGKEFEAGSS